MGEKIEDAFKLGDCQHEPALKALFIAQWSQVDPFPDAKAERTLPRPITLLDRADQVVGGLAFTTYPHPQTSESAVWINALLVVPQYRRRGLASHLIDLAHTRARDLGVSTLFVLTEYPDLYRHNGWQVLAKDDTGCILSVSL